jgi:imidazole glycerol-phosphate synthase subunit HisH
MPVIAVIDYGSGNLHSACKGLEKAGGNPQLASTAAAIAAADAIVLPGVGSFDPAIQHLRDRDLEAPLKQAIASGKPFLGICVGMQLLFERSAEGVEPGLGIIPGTVEKFQPEPQLTIPHMGWNQLELTPLAKFTESVVVFCPFLFWGAARSARHCGDDHPWQPDRHDRDRPR